MHAVHTAIVGGSAAGLACAKCLKDQGLIDFVILEHAEHIGQKWRNHYERLHLHTSKKWSQLPGKAYPADQPQYPPRNAVVDYLVEYARENDLHPQFNTTVQKIERQSDGLWRVETNQGHYLAHHVIMATGMNHTPKMAEFEGLDAYTGRLLHSSEYKNGQPFAGQQVLVVGFGNSGCEQAICLHEHGASPSLSVRSGVNVLPRDLWGMPILEASKFTKWMPPKIADLINWPIIRYYIGDIARYGLKKHRYGPAEQLRKENRVPLLDIGTMRLIREGHITVYPNIQKIVGKAVYFEDGRAQDFDAIIMATGYRHNLRAWLTISDERLADLKQPIQKQRFVGQDGLYLCGFYLSPNGMLHEIAHEARFIAQTIQRQSVA